jgi:PAS domain S-box-containing protein
MVRFQLLDITPIAHEQILENMNDGVVVMDIRGRIISLNGPAVRYLGIPEEGSIGAAAADVLPAPSRECISGSGSLGEAGQQYEIEREIDGRIRFFELRCVPIHSHRAEAKGRMILIRDITDQKQAELALSGARKKLSLLSSITRHDILNQVTALLLNIDFAKESVSDPEMQGWLSKQEDAVVRIQHHIEFARDYEDLGVRAPRWMSVNRIFSDLTSVIDAHGITLDIMPGEVEIFADPLLERVFSNLVDNSIQHGSRVTSIRVRYENSGDGLALIYEDNGVGVPSEDKEKIFERGVGRQNGLGLFLVMEILGITGLTIRECGEPGKGARFEIRVRNGKFRITP